MNVYRGWEIYEKGIYDILKKSKQTMIILNALFLKMEWVSREKSGLRMKKE